MKDIGKSKTESIWTVIFAILKCAYEIYPYQLQFAFALLILVDSFWTNLASAT